MIVKQACSTELPADPRFRAGAEAERQMAYYLHEAFALDEHVHILNDLRLVDPDQPSFRGSPLAHQIDHLIVHRWGMFIVESKSARGGLIVSPDGSGGDIWQRRYGGTLEGMPSPIQQARRQAEFLRAYLEARKAQLLGKILTGFRTIAKLVKGTDQRGFRNMPMQVIIAIADDGQFRMANSWQPPTEPFRTFVTKADQVVDKLKSELAAHKHNHVHVLTSKGEYGIWSMTRGEVGQVAHFLSEQHTPLRVSASPSTSAEQNAPERPQRSDPATHNAKDIPSCKSCGERDILGQSGKYGYYWKCNACGVNTAMPAVCTQCGAKGFRGQHVRIWKNGTKYYRSCDRCLSEEEIWTER